MQFYFFRSLNSSPYLLQVQRVTVAPHHTQWYTHTHTHTHFVWLLWRRDRPVAHTYSWQHNTTITTDIHPHLTWDSNPQSKKWAIAGQRLRPRGRRDRLKVIYSTWLNKVQISIRRTEVFFSSLGLSQSQLYCHCLQKDHSFCNELLY